MLQAWQARHLPYLRNETPKSAENKDVTLVAYHFWQKDRFDPQFDFLETAIRETWHHCGLLKTVLVVNMCSKKLELFAAELNGWVEIQIAPLLVPGSLYSMSRDCIGQLYARFDTDNVLIIQNDGFPIRRGLGDFIGKFDYIGAPWLVQRPNWISRVLLPHGFNVGNGGFSLRSKRICEKASWYYKHKYKLLPDFFLMTEDFFFMKTLPSYERAYRNEFRIPPLEVAAQFSLESNFDLYDAANTPFGFHGHNAFQKLFSDGKINTDQQH